MFILEKRKTDEIIVRCLSCDIGKLFREVRIHKKNLQAEKVIVKVFIWDHVIGEGVWYRLLPFDRTDTELRSLTKEDDVSVIDKLKIKNIRKVSIRKDKRLCTDVHLMIKIDREDFKILKKYIGKKRNLKTGQTRDMQVFREILSDKIMFDGFEIKLSKELLTKKDKNTYKTKKRNYYI